MMFGSNPLVTAPANLARRPTLLRRLTVVVLLSLMTLTALWLLWLWRASDQQAEAEVREHLTEEIARLVALFETYWPERAAYLRLEVQNHVSHEGSVALAAVDGAATVLAADDPAAIGKPMDEALPSLIAPYRHFLSDGGAFALWRTKNVLWGAARWSITPGRDTVGPDGVILIGYDLTPTRTVVRNEITITLIGPYAAFLVTLLIVAGWLWHYHLGKH